LRDIDYTGLEMAAQQAGSNPATEKYYLSYAQIHETVKRLAGEVARSGFDPEVIVAIGTGGFIPARILKTFVNRPIYAVGISYYGVDNVPMATPQTIQWIDEVEKKLTGKRVLLVDEVDDSRVTLEYCLRELLSHRPKEVAVMVLHNKNKQKHGRLPPEILHYFVGQETGDRWICYPWDAEDISAHEARARVEKPA
jgi:hypoxanthine phosphoribosyltransferase